MISNNEVIFKAVRSDGTLEGYVENNFNFTAICCGQTLVGGKNNILSGNYTTVVGGSNNTIIGSHTSILGGQNNYRYGEHISIVGGQNNRALASGSSIVGGESNQTCSNNSFIGGGIYNCITDTSQRSFVGGGNSNVSAANLAVIAGGECNYINGFNSSVGGGFCNVVDAPHSTIVGGARNTICCGGEGRGNIIAHGDQNQIGAVNCYSFIGNGCLHHAAPNSSNTFIGNGNCNGTYLSDSAVILNGTLNCINSSCNTILNGFCNEIRGGFSSSNLIGGGNENKIGITTSDGCSWSKYSTVLNGLFNCIVGTNVAGECENISLFSSILGGSNNIIRGDYGSILGGSCNTIAANNGLALGGKCINITHNGSAVIGDSTVNLKNSEGAFTLSLNFSNGTFVKNKLMLHNTSSSPTSSSSAGTSGQMILDSNYLYYHNGSQWRRTALSEW